MRLTTPIPTPSMAARNTALWAWIGSKKLHLVLLRVMLYTPFDTEYFVARCLKSPRLFLYRGLQNRSQFHGYGTAGRKCIDVIWEATSWTYQRPQSLHHSFSATDGKSQFHRYAKITFFVGTSPTVLTAPPVPRRAKHRLVWLTLFS